MKVTQYLVRPRNHMNIDQRAAADWCNKKLGDAGDAQNLSAAEDIMKSCSVADDLFIEVEEVEIEE